MAGRPLINPPAPLLYADSLRSYLFREAEIQSGDPLGAWQPWFRTKTRAFAPVASSGAAPPDAEAATTAVRASMSCWALTLLMYKISALIHLPSQSPLVLFLGTLSLMVVRCPDG